MFGKRYMTLLPSFEWRNPYLVACCITGDRGSLWYVFSLWCISDPSATKTSHSESTRPPVLTVDLNSLKATVKRLMGLATNMLSPFSGSIARMNAIRRIEMILSRQTVRRI